VVRKSLAGLLIATSVFGEVLYATDGRDFQVCVEKNKTFSIDFPCNVTDVYYTPELDADVKKTAPMTVVGVLTEDTGSLTAVCKNRSFTFVFRAKEGCDNHKTIRGLHTSGKPLDEGKFNYQSLLNRARGLMKGMIRGESVRGYRIKPIKVKTVLNNDDYFRAEFNQIYEGSRLVGFVGTIRNYSKFIDKVFDAKKMMKKGYVLLYVEGMESPVVKLKPEEERKIFIVALKGKTKIPYLERK